MRRIKLAHLPALEQEDVTARLNEALDEERKTSEQISNELAQQQSQGSQTQPVITEQVVTAPVADGAGNATSNVPPQDPALDPTNQSAQAAAPIGVGDPAPAVVPPVAETTPGVTDPVSGQAQAVGDTPNADTAAATDAAEAAAAQASAELAQAEQAQADANATLAQGEVAEPATAPLTVEEVNVLVNSGKSPEEIVEILKSRTVEATPAITDAAANGATGELTPQTTLDEAASTATDATGAADAGNAIPDANGVQASAGGASPDQVLDQAGNVDPAAATAPTEQAAQTTPAPAADPATTTDPQGEVNGATAQDPGQEVAGTTGAADGSSASSAGAIDADADPGTKDAAAGAIDAAQTTETAPVVDANGEQVATATVTTEPAGATQDAGAPTGEVNGDPTTVTSTTPAPAEGLTTGEAKEVAEGAQTIEQSEAQEPAAAAAAADASADTAAAAASTADAAAADATATAAETGSAEDAAAAAVATDAAAQADASADEAAATAAQADTTATQEPPAQQEPATDPAQADTGTSAEPAATEEPAAGTEPTGETNLNGEPAPAASEDTDTDENVDPDANLNDIIEEIDADEEVKTEVEDMVDEAYGVSDRLGKIADIVQDVMQEDENGMSEGLAKIVSIATESLYERVGITPNYQLMALESYETENARNLAGQIALEDIKENVQRVAQAIVKGIQHLIQLIVETVKRVIGGNAMAKRDLKNLRAAAEAAKASGNPAKATTIESARLASMLRLGSQVEADPRKTFAPVQRVATVVFGDLRNWSYQTATEMDAAFSKWLNSGEYKTAQIVLPPLRDINLPGFVEKSGSPDEPTVSVSEELPGGKAIEFMSLPKNRREGDATAVSKLFSQLAKKQLGGKLVDLKEEENIAVSETVPTLTPDQVIAFCDEGDKIIKALELNKKVLDDNAQFLRNMKTIRFASKSIPASDLGNMNLRTAFSAMGGIGVLFVEPASAYASYMLRVLNAYITYSKQSLAQYQVTAQTTEDNRQLAAA